LRPFFVLAT